MVLLRKCCCCIDLPTGGFIFGCISIIFWICIIIIGSQMDKYSAVYDPSIVIGQSVTLCVGTISLILNFCLFWGAYKKERLMLLPWIILNAIKIVFLFFTIVITASVFSSLILLSLLFLCIDVYIWICIVSLYQICSENSIHFQRLRENENIIINPNDNFIIQT